MKRRWYVVEYDDQYGKDTTIRRRALMSVGASGTWYWGYGPGQPFKQSKTEYTILKDYGMVDGSKEDMNLRYCQDFPPEPTDLDTYPLAKDLDGWIDLEGHIYKVPWGGHSEMAESILLSRGIEVSHPSYAERILYDEGWINLRHSLATSEWHKILPTCAQLNILMKLRDLNKSFKTYADGIDDYLEVIGDEFGDQND